MLVIPSQQFQHFLFPITLVIPSLDGCRFCAELQLNQWVNSNNTLYVRFKPLQHGFVVTFSRLKTVLMVVLTVRYRCSDDTFALGGRHVGVLILSHCCVAKKTYMILS